MACIATSYQAECSGSILALVRQNIEEASYVYAEAAKQLIISMNLGKFLEFRTSEIASAGFSRHRTANTGLADPNVCQPYSAAPD